MMNRRGFLTRAGLALLALQSGLKFPAVHAAEQTLPPKRYGEIQVPYSSGRQVPSIKIPPLACDCHHHIYDPVRFPYLPTDTRNQPPATVDAYRLLQQRLGLTRNVIVTPSAYGFDNSCTLDALKQMGSKARAEVVVDTSITDAELKRMHSLGVRGIRFNIATGASNDSEKNHSVIKKNPTSRLACAILDDGVRYCCHGRRAHETAFRYRF